jgi:hypothetical protein
MKFRELTSIFKFECEEAARRPLTDLTWFTRTWQWYYFSVGRLLEDGAEIFIAREDPDDFGEIRRFNTLIWDMPGPACGVWAGFVMAFSEEHARREMREALGIG